jgi:hypothetical protein
MQSPKVDVTTVQRFRRDELLQQYAIASQMSATRESDTETLTLPIPPLYNSVTALNDTIKQIIAIMHGDEGDENGPLRPTQRALDQVSRILIDACNAFLQFRKSAQFPGASVSPDLGGGLRIEWYMPKGVVCFVVPPSGSAPYLFHRIGAEAKTDFSVTGSSIASWLNKGL